MRGSGFYTAYWLLTRPLVWVFRLAFGGICSLVTLLFRAPSGGVVFAPLSSGEQKLRWVVAANLAVTAISATTAAGSPVPGMQVRRTDPLGLLHHPGAWLLGAFVLLALYVALDGAAARDTIMAILGFLVAVVQLMLTAGLGWIWLAAVLTAAMLWVMRTLTSSHSVVRKIGVVVIVLVGYQVMTAVVAG